MDEYRLSIQAVLQATEAIIRQSGVICKFSKLFLAPRTSNLLFTVNYALLEAGSDTSYSLGLALHVLFEQLRLFKTVQILLHIS